LASRPKASPGKQASQAPARLERRRPRMAAPRRRARRRDARSVAAAARRPLAHDAHVLAALHVKHVVPRVVAVAAVRPAVRVVRPVRLARASAVLRVLRRGAVRAGVGVAGAVAAVRGVAVGGRLPGLVVLAGDARAVGRRRREAALLRRLGEGGPESAATVGASLSCGPGPMAPLPSRPLPGPCPSSRLPSAWCPWREGQTAASVTDASAPGTRSRRRGRSRCHRRALCVRCELSPAARLLPRLRIDAQYKLTVCSL
jgi:hypothetical protein